MWHLIKLLTFDAVDLQQNKCKSPLPHLVSQLVCVCLPLPVVSVKCKAPASRETGCVFSSDNLRLVLPFVQVWRRLPILSHSSITTLRKDFVWKPGAAKKKRTNKYKYFNKEKTGEEKEDLLNRILETLRQKCEIIEMWNCQVKMITYKIQIMRNKWKIYISCRGKVCTDCEAGSPSAIFRAKLNHLFLFSTRCQNQNRSCFLMPSECTHTRNFLFSVGATQY